MSDKKKCTCGVRGKNACDFEECKKRKQVRAYGLNKVEKSQVEKPKRKAKPKPKPKPKAEKLTKLEIAIKKIEDDKNKSIKKLKAAKLEEFQLKYLINATEELANKRIFSARAFIEEEPQSPKDILKREEMKKRAKTIQVYGN